MFKPECWKKIENGLYGYKNGITVRHEGKQWIVYYCSGAIGYNADTLKACKAFIAHNFD